MWRKLFVFLERSYWTWLGLEICCYCFKNVMNQWLNEQVDKNININQIKWFEFFRKSTPHTTKLQLKLTPSLPGESSKFRLIAAEVLGATEGKEVSFWCFRSGGTVFATAAAVQLLPVFLHNLFAGMISLQWHRRTCHTLHFGSGGKGGKKKSCKFMPFN